MAKPILFSMNELPNKEPTIRDTTSKLCTPPALSAGADSLNLSHKASCSLPADSPQEKKVGEATRLTPRPHPNLSIISGHLLRLKI